MYSFFLFLTQNKVHSYCSTIWRLRLNSDLKLQPQILLKVLHLFLISTAAQSSSQPTKGSSGIFPTYTFFPKEHLGRSDAMHSTVNLDVVPNLPPLPTHSAVSTTVGTSPPAASFHRFTFFIHLFWTRVPRMQRLLQQHQVSCIPAPPLSNSVLKTSRQAKAPLHLRKSFLVHHS